MTRKFNMSLVGSGALIALVACTAGVDSQEPRTPRNLEEFDALFQEYNNWGRWGKDDQVGAVNMVTNEKRAAAARLVKTGRAVSLSREFPKTPAPNNPTPAQHFMN